MPRGGKREGSGRKAMPEEAKKQPFNRHLKPESIAKLKALTESRGMKSEAEMLELLIDEAPL
jgi:hypothetical protein